MDNTLTDSIRLHLRENSGLEAHRPYVGMSAMAECELELYRRYLGPRPVTDYQHAMCYLGYLFERDLKTRLADLGYYRPGSERELLAPFDDRFRGHTEGETVEGALLEIKSVTENKLMRIRRDSRLPDSHFYQVQTYLRYGPYDEAVVVYVCRDTLEHHVQVSRRKEVVGEQMELKAQRVLAAIDAGVPPPCVCGKCPR